MPRPANIPRGTPNTPLGEAHLEAHGKLVDGVENIHGELDQLPTVPPGGLPGQVLAKVSSADFHVAWVTPSGPGPTPTVPDAPTNVQAMAGNAQATVSWAAPANNGGSPITGYAIIGSPGGSLSVGNVTNGTITGLINETVYTFTVRAINVIGQGPASAPSGPVMPSAETPSNPPPPPVDISVMSGDGQVTVSWSPGTNPFLGVASGYVLWINPVSDPEDINQITVGASPHTITDLTNGTAYIVWVRAVNAIGGSDWKPDLGVVFTPSATGVVPSIPLNLAAEAGDGQATFTWDAPVYVGSSPITGYELSVNPLADPTGMTNFTVTASPYTMTGLTNETHYQVWIRAINAIGNSFWTSLQVIFFPTALVDLVAYPPRVNLGLGYNDVFTAPQAALAKAGGCTHVRTGMAWASAENYSTGQRSLLPGWAGFLANCAVEGLIPTVIAAYAPPWQQIGTLVTAANVPAATPAGTPIPVQPYSFTIDFPSCFVNDANDRTIAQGWSYYGTLITASTSSSITLAAATWDAIPAGTTLRINRLRYPPPWTDADPSNDAYIAYAQWIGQQIHDAGIPEGYVTIWNEYVWPNDTWNAPARFWDNSLNVPSDLTLSNYWRGALQKIASSSLPSGIHWQNGISDVSGFGGVAIQEVSPLSAFVADGIHPYGSTPETSNWRYDRPRSWPNWWENINPWEQGGNFRHLAYVNDQTPDAPALWATECGALFTNEATFARHIARRVASLWGVNVLPFVFTFDGYLEMAVAPNLEPRDAYYSLQLMMAMIGRMDSGSDTSQPVASVVAPSIGFSAWPLMSVIICGATGHHVLFVWQRTNAPTGWEEIPSPSPVTVTINVPSGLGVEECIDVVTRQTVAHTPGSGTIDVPVTDNPLAVRFSAS